MRVATTGRDYRRLMGALTARIQEYGLQTDSSSGNLIVCMRAAQGPLDEREDYCVRPPYHRLLEPP